MQKLMNGIITLIISIVIVFFTTLCGRKNNTIQIPIINIGSNIWNMEVINLSSYADDIRYIPLEEMPQNPINMNSKIIMDCSDKYIIDSDGMTIILYDKNGRYLYKIGKQGRGPGEYSSLSYLRLLEDKVFVYDYSSDDLIEYNLDGTFAERHRSGFTAVDKYILHDVFIVNDSMILGSIDNVTGNLPYKALVIDKQGNIKYSVPNYVSFKLASGIKYLMSPGDASICKFDNKLFFKEFYNDTIFQFDSQFSLLPSYVVDLGKYREPFIKRGMSWEKKEITKHIYLTNFFDVGTFIILICDYNMYFPSKRLTPKVIKIQGLKEHTLWINTNSMLGIYDKETGNVSFSQPTSTDVFLSTTGFYNDIDGGPRFLPDKLINDSIMVMKLGFDELSELIASKDFKDNMPKYDKKKRDLEILVDSLNRIGFSNTVYMFITLKTKKGLGSYN